MKHFFISMLSEDSECTGISMTRIMAIISLLMGCYLAFIGRETSLVSVFVGSAFGAKLVSKHIETRS